MRPLKNAQFCLPSYSVCQNNVPFQRMYAAFQAVRRNRQRYLDKRGFFAKVSLQMGELDLPEE